MFTIQELQTIAELIGRAPIQGREATAVFRLQQRLNQEAQELTAAPPTREQIK